MEAKGGSAMGPGRSRGRRLGMRWRTGRRERERAASGRRYSRWRWAQEAGRRRAMGAAPAQEAGQGREEWLMSGGEMGKKATLEKEKWGTRPRWSVHVHGQRSTSPVNCQLGLFWTCLTHLNRLGTGLDTFKD